MLSTPAHKAGGYRRQWRIISPRFQWRYAALIAAAVALVTTLCSFAMFAQLHHEARLRLIHPENSEAGVTGFIICFSAGLSVLSGGLVAVGSFLFTHRISGPLFILGRYIKEFEQGRLPKVRPLRRYDEFKELVASFGTAIESLALRRQAVLECLNGVMEHAEELRSGAKEPTTTVAALRNKVEEARRCLLGESAATTGAPAAVGAAPGQARTGLGRQIACT